MRIIGAGRNALNGDPALQSSVDSPLPPWFAALSGRRLLSGRPGPAARVCHDSRDVTGGAVFVAVPGIRQDGNSFIPDAIARGASAIVVQGDTRERWVVYVAEDVAFVEIPEARVALAEAAAGQCGFPARTLGMVGVTGTDGKTTTTHLVAHALRGCGRPTGYLSSVEFAAGAARELNASHMTTLEADDVQLLLARIRDAGERYAVVEASSIGLELHRVDQCEFDVGVFTNLAPDHLDYHGTMAAYRGAKARLFQMVARSAAKPGVEKAAVLNADDPASEAMRAATQAAVPTLTYGLAGGDIRARDITRAGWGTDFAVRAGGEERRAHTNLQGAYNVANSLAAVAVAVSQGVDFREAVEALASFPGVPGRMEPVDEGQPFRVVVDIASTEQAMRNVLGELRPMTAGRLIAVFGAAGERDRERRRGIARAVAQGADFALITSEDPRSEEPGAIIDEIAGALVGFGWTEPGRVERRTERRDALARAFELARPGDTVVLAGKGTEQSIVVGAEHRPWDERRVARELLRGVRRQ